MSRHLAVTSLLEERLLRGDYALRSFPSERQLASELDVSRVTVRKALSILAQRGVLSGRGGDLSKKKSALSDKELEAIFTRPTSMQLAFLMPPVVSHDVQVWQRNVEQTATIYGAVLRTVVYAAWTDVIVRDVLSSFDGVFIMDAGAPMPASVLGQIKASSTPVVSLVADLSAHGIPSVVNFPRRCSDPLLDHCVALGHQTIACLNSYASVPAVQGRIADWQGYMVENGLSGPLINQYLAIGGDGNDAARQAYAEVGRLIDSNSIGATALFCTALWTALGAMKAISDHGLVVGRDLSVCCVNDEGMAQWQTPELTSLRAPDTRSLLAPCIDWIARRGRDWLGPLLITPGTNEVFVGRSTGPPANAGATKMG